RVEVDPAQLVALADTGIKGKHPEPPAGAAAPAIDDELREIMESDPQPSQSQPSQSQPSQSQLQPSQSQPRVPKKPPPGRLTTMRMWLPASMMRQVHPGLVEDFEAAEEVKRAKKAGVGKRKNRRHAEAEESSEDEPPSSPVRPVAGCTQPSPTTSQWPGGPSVQGVPQPIAGPSRTRAAFEEWSLPMRDCGFVFTFSDPDDPDQVVGEDNSDNVPSTGERIGGQVARHIDNGASSSPSVSMREKGKGTNPTTRQEEMIDRILGIAPDGSAPARAKGKGKAPANRRKPRASQSRASGSRDEPTRANQAEDELPEEEPGSGSHLTQMMDKILGIVPGASRGRVKGKAPAKRRRRTSVPAGGSGMGMQDAVNSIPAKRRRTIHGAEVAPLLRDEDNENEPIPQVRQGTPPRASSAPRLAPFPVLSPLKPPPSLAARIPGHRLVPPPLTNTEGLRIIEIESDDDDELLPFILPGRSANVSSTVSTTAATQSRTASTSGRRCPSSATALSSQDSARGFRGDPDMVIDLT
ncbi:hypothetical protein B0H21DRAFT_362378, partial [Amylocystis lapponica]